MMADLISRAAAIGCLGNSPEQMCMPWSEVERMLRELPAVDAAPVVHGRWIYHDDDIMPWVSCSKCGVCTDSMNKTPFCPYCGARLDGEQHLAFADQSGAEYADNPTV